MRRTAMRQWTNLALTALLFGAVASLVGAAWTVAENQPALLALLNG